MRLLPSAGLSVAIALATAASLSAQDSSSQSQVAQDAPPPPQYPTTQTVQPQATGHAFNHGEVGAYGDFLRVAPSGNSGVNYVGVGGRVGVNAGTHVAIEAEMNYDFERNYTTTTTTGTGGTVTTSTVTSKVRPLTGLFGPKFQFGTSGPVRAFVEGKVGFINVTETNNAPSTTTFTNSVAGVGGPGTHLAAFPGGGIEFFAGPFGLRAEVGDEIWVNNGANNNLRVTFGPTIRF
jgi:hypothetical protein